MLATLDVYYLTFYIDTTLLALLVFGAFYRYRRRSRSVKLLGWVFLLSFLANVLSYLLIGALRNVPGTVFDFAMMFFIGWLYNNETGGKHRNYLIVCTIIYFIFGIYNVFYVQPLTISSYNKLFASFLIISYTVMFFYKLMKDLPERQVHQLPMFWFNSALLIFYAGTLFLFAFTSYLINVLKNDLLFYMLFHNLLSVIHHYIFIIGLRYDLRRLDSSGVKGLTRQLSRN
jgi:hypothetical protein